MMFLAIFAGMVVGGGGTLFALAALAWHMDEKCRTGGKVSKCPKKDQWIEAK
jgi:hypothetical protein